jgi:hypothetical protein
MWWVWSRIRSVSEYLKSTRAILSTCYDKRLKVCTHCNVEFSDVTKRNHRKTCDDFCDVAIMVAKRRERGSYTRTKEQNEKHAITLKATNASRDCYSAETRRGHSERLKKRWAEGKIDTSNHWTKTPEGKARLSIQKKNVKFGAKARHNMSLGAQRRLRTKRETHYTSARGGKRPDLANQYFRSCWEANFARILNFQGKRWTYEEHSFQLEPSLSYTPDFFIIDENAFYELKGHMDDKSRKQFELMNLKFPDVIIHVIDHVKYAQLKLEFKHSINWEGK